MKSYENHISKSNSLTNTFALNTLLEVGRKNLLDNNYFEKMLNGVNENSFMTADYQKEILKIAKNMAELKDKDLCEYIYDKVKTEKRLERGR